MKTYTLFLIALAVIVVIFTYADLFGKNFFAGTTKETGSRVNGSNTEVVSESTSIPPLGSKVEISHGKTGKVIGYRAEGAPVVR